MERAAILQVIIKHLRANVDIEDDVEIDPQNSMASLGAQSLDITEIVSASIRELKIKVPRTALRNLNNVNDLTNLLYKKVQEAS